MRNGEDNFLKTKNTRIEVDPTHVVVSLEVERVEAHTPLIKVDEDCRLIAGSLDSTCGASGQRKKRLGG